VKALQITHKPQEYISLAKLVAGGHIVASTNGAPPYQPWLEDFYGTIIETLESKSMRRQALERVRLLNPDLKQCEMDVHITQSKGSTVINVAAIGSEPKYTRVFLDALLDEFSAFRDNIREQQRNKALTALAKDSRSIKDEMASDYVTVMQRAEVAVENVEGWLMPVIHGAFVGGFGGMVLLLIIAAALSGRSPHSYPLPPPPLPDTDKGTA
jgi:hypothetical protein